MSGMRARYASRRRVAKCLRAATSMRSMRDDDNPQPIGLVPPRGPGIPIFPIVDYTYYLRVTNIAPAEGGFDLTFEAYRFSARAIRKLDGDLNGAVGIRRHVHGADDRGRGAARLSDAGQVLCRRGTNESAAAVPPDGMGVVVAAQGGDRDRPRAGFEGPTGQQCGHELAQRLPVVRLGGERDRQR